MCIVCMVKENVCYVKGVEFISFCRTHSLSTIVNYKDYDFPFDTRA